MNVKYFHYKKEGLELMEYETFKQIAAIRIKEFLPPVFRTFEIQFLQVQKTNQVKEAMILAPAESDYYGAIPNIYLEDMYERLETSGDLEEVLEQMAAIVLYFTGMPAPDVEHTDLENMTDRIAATLVNADRNKKMLETAPHINFLDLAVVYRFIIKREDGEGYLTSLITNDIAESLELSPEDLWQLAEKNRSSLMPVKILSLAEQLSVLTNEGYLYGASGLLCGDVLQELASKMNGDLYLVPSSIHEIMVMPAESSDFHELLRILDEGNRLYTSENEFLSDKVYWYEKKTGKITVMDIKDNEKVEKGQL